MRAAQPSDKALVYEIYCDDSVNLCLTDEVPSKERFQPVFDSIMKRDYVWIFQDHQGKDCAMASAVKGMGRSAHIIELLGVFIHSSAQGQGLGKRMIADMIGYLFDAGFTRIQLFVESDNLRAIELYRTSGFEEEGRMRQFMRRDDGYIDKIIMARLKSE